MSTPRLYSFPAAAAKLERRQDLPRNDFAGSARPRRRGLMLPRGARVSLIDAGAHFTFLQAADLMALWSKPLLDTCKLTLGQLRHGGVWLSPVEEIGEQLAVAEGIETALSVMQITKLPTVAALSAAGMRSLRWPSQVRRLWIAADNDAVGLRAAEALLARALSAGLQAHIKIPARGKE